MESSISSNSCVVRKKQSPKATIINLIKAGLRFVTYLNGEIIRKGPRIRIVESSAHSGEAFGGFVKKKGEFASTIDETILNGIITGSF